MIRAGAIRTGNRRQVFAGGALAFTAAAIPSVLRPVDALAGNKGGKGKGKNRDKARAADNRILNYALTLEHLEYAFYRDGLAGYSAGDFGPGVYANLIVIRDHEGDHVDALTATIQERGGKPVSELCYDFGTAFTNPADFLSTAQALENTGVQAYDGAISRIKSPNLQTTGATIATVEARHASYLNFVNGAIPFPDAFDMPKSEDEILAIAGPFIVACNP